MAETSPRPVGISLAGFYALIARLGGPDQMRTTLQLKEQHILPCTAATRTSYVAQLVSAGPPSASHVGAATAFISHAYDYSFLDVVESVAAWERSDPARAGTFYYLDLLCVSQHRDGDSPIVPFEVLSGEFCSSVRAIGRTLLVLRWRDPVPLRRAWCVLEIACTLAAGATLEVVMPPADAATFVEDLEGSFDSIERQTCHVDVERAEARLPADLANIRRVIKGWEGGFERTNQRVIGAMKSWMVGAGRAALAGMQLERRATSALVNHLPMLLAKQGDLTGAEELFRAALSDRRALGNIQLIMESTNNLGTLLKDIPGSQGEAEKLLHQALQWKLSAHGASHPSTLSTMCTLGVLLKRQGRCKEALVLYDRALAGRRENLHHAQARQEGAEVLHRLRIAVLESTGNKGNLLKHMAQQQGHPGNNSGNSPCALWLSEAEALHREALQGFEELEGAHHPSTLSALVNLAGTLAAAGALEPAEAHLSRAVAGRLQVLGEKHHDTVAAREGLNALRQLLMD